MSRFIATKEHRRFCEFANAVRKDRTIGLCYGSAGVGKTLSAHRYSGWDKAHPMFSDWYGSKVQFREESGISANAALARSRTLFYTPHVQSNPRTVRSELDEILGRTHLCIEQHFIKQGEPLDRSGATIRRPKADLIIVDEAERLATQSIEVLRDRYDREGIGLILIGMPGLEKQFSRYPQFY
nr:ATP-binding protein [Actinomycetes bacterium]